MGKSLLIVGVLCLSLAVVAFGETNIFNSFIEKAQSTPFGETLWGTIQLELQSGAPGDYLINLLNKMRQTVEEDITKANATHKDFQDKCNAEINGLKHEIKNHAKSVVESKDLIKKSNARLTWASIEIDTEKRQLAEAKENLEKITVIRQKEAAEYEKKMVELNDALLVLHQGKSMIEKNLLKQGAFVQVSNEFNAYVRKMSSSIGTANYHGRGYVSMIAYIAELIQAAPVQANQGAVQKVLELIQGIIDEIERAKNVEFKAEQERVNNFNQLLAIYNKSINDLTEGIEKLTNEVNHLKQIIEYNQRRIKENTRAIRVKKRQEIKLKKECRSEMAQFNKENAKRMSDFSLVQEAIAIITENIDQFRKIVVDTAKAAIVGKFGSTSI